MVFEVLQVKSKKDNSEYVAVPQYVQVGSLLGESDGRTVFRTLVGILNYQEFSMVEAIYDNDKFNDKYEVIGTKYIDIENELIIKTTTTLEVKSEPKDFEYDDPAFCPHYDPVDRI